MTKEQQINLWDDLMAYNGTISKVVRKNFIKKVKQDNDAYNQAYALFGERGVYDVKDQSFFWRIISGNYEEAKVNRQDKKIPYSRY